MTLSVPVATTMCLVSSWRSPTSTRPGPTIRPLPRMSVAPSASTLAAFSHRPGPRSWSPGTRRSQAIRGSLPVLTLPGQLVPPGLSCDGCHLELPLPCGYCRPRPTMSATKRGRGATNAHDSGPRRDVEPYGGALLCLSRHRILRHDRTGGLLRGYGHDVGLETGGL